MTTQRIEEIRKLLPVEVMGFDEIDKAEEWIRQTLTQLRQETLDEAVEVVKGMKWKGEPPESADDITWAVHKERNQALDDTIKALRDKK